MIQVSKNLKILIKLEIYSIDECHHQECLEYFNDISLNFSVNLSKSKKMEELKNFLRFLYTYHDPKIISLKLVLYYTSLSLKSSHQTSSE